MEPFFSATHLGAILGDISGDLKTWGTRGMGRLGIWPFDFQFGSTRPLQNSGHMAIGLHCARYLTGWQFDQIIHMEPFGRTHRWSLIAQNVAQPQPLVRMHWCAVRWTCGVKV
jgi:hypothetical protein